MLGSLHDGRPRVQCRAPTADRTTAHGKRQSRHGVMRPLDIFDFRKPDAKNVMQIFFARSAPLLRRIRRVKPPQPATNTRTRSERPSDGPECSRQNTRRPVATVNSSQQPRLLREGLDMSADDWVDVELVCTEWVRVAPFSRRARFLWATEPFEPGRDLAKSRRGFKAS